MKPVELVCPICNARVRTSRPEAGPGQTCSQCAHSISLEKSAKPTSINNKVNDTPRRSPPLSSRTFFQKRTWEEFWVPRVEDNPCRMTSAASHELKTTRGTQPVVEITEESQVNSSKMERSELSTTPPPQTTWSALFLGWIDRRRAFQEIVTLLLLISTLGFTGYYWFQGPRQLLNDADFSSSFSLQESQEVSKNLPERVPPPQMAWNWSEPPLVSIPEPLDPDLNAPMLDNSPPPPTEIEPGPVLQVATLLHNEHPFKEATPSAENEVAASAASPIKPKPKPNASDLNRESALSRNAKPKNLVPEPSESEPERIIIGDASGRAMVSRFYARGEDRVVVQLPDGSLGWANGEVKTAAPFVPWTLEEVLENLLQGPYQDFLAVEEGHYLVFYQKSRRRPYETEAEARQRQANSEAFARQSARLLEDLLGQLLERLERLDFEVQEPEFPLVVVIFRDEDEFQAHRKVAADVRAYYEIYSNRVFLYETSDRDQQAPDLAAMRRPQIIAHEGTHQILQNIGVQPRLACWPAWLVEGLAEYCAPATSRPGWDGPRFGRVNPFHMATLIDLQDPNTLREHLQSAGLNASTWADWGRTSPWIEHLLTASELSPTDYSLAWALNHYLMTRQFNDLLRYLKKMSALDPLKPRTNEQHLADFREAFGQDLIKLARRVSQHLSRLEYEKVPFYAVLLEQAMPPGLVRREGYVTQSVPMIYHWVNVRTSREAGPVHWRAVPHASKNQARFMTRAWIDHH